MKSEIVIANLLLGVVLFSGCIAIPTPGRLSRYASISGIVRDDESRAVPNASVKIESNGIVSIVETDNEGKFAADFSEIRNWFVIVAAPTDRFIRCEAWVTANGYFATSWLGGRMTGMNGSVQFSPTITLYSESPRKLKTKNGIDLAVDRRFSDLNGLSELVDLLYPKQKSVSLTGFVLNSDEEFDYATFFFGRNIEVGFESMYYRYIVIAKRRSDVSWSNAEWYDLPDFNYVDGFKGPYSVLKEHGTLAHSTKGTALD